MQAWDVVILGGSTASLRAAIAASDGGATVTILTPSSPSAFVDDVTSCGLAASSGETNPSVHAADVHRVGANLCEADVVASSTSSAVAHLSELERWGLNLRRDRNGSPHLGQLPGQSNPRTASTGDSTLREVRTILEEQCIKRNIPRRGDIEILDLVHKDHDETKAGPKYSSSDDGFDVCGLIALDLQSGEVFAIQAKSILLAGSGFQSAWNGDGCGMGSAAHLFLKLGHYLSDLEFTSRHPLTVSNTDLHIPLDVLGSGGVVNGPDGQPLEIDGGPDALAREILSVGGASLDLTAISRDDSPWFANVAKTLQSRCGIDCSQQLIPLMPSVSTTIGGLPTDLSGNVCSFDWDPIPGLFAAGDAACTGLHGAAINSGDHLLGTLTSGSIAGTAAAIHAAKSKHSGSGAISSMLTEAHHLHDSILAAAGSEGVSPGHVQSQLSSTMQTHMGHGRSAGGLGKALSTIEELSEANMVISDSSPVMNTELVRMLRTKGLVQVARSAVRAATERTESRGSHNRTDFPEADDEQLHHSLQSSTYPGTLALRN